MKRDDLTWKYPPIEPYATHRLDVGDGHNLYVEEVGNPDGLPVVFIHGGPGAGCSPEDRRFFDPKAFRVILFDQRGSNRSTPVGKLEANSTFTLIDDIERIREKFGVDKWIVFGGSWGSTLSLCYAIKHPSRVTGLVIRGIFLGRAQEADWLYRYGGMNVFPEEYALLTEGLPEGEKKNMVETFFQKFQSKDPAVSKKYMRRWIRYEFALAKLIPGDVNWDNAFSDDLLKGFCMINTKYFLENMYLPTDNWILENISAIEKIPMSITQGRYDMLCPVVSANELHRACPNSLLNIVPDAGHSAHDPSNARSLVAAMDRWAGTVR